MQYEQLNHYDLPDDDTGYSDAWRRVLSRLGDYTAIIVRSLNMRPSAVRLLAQTQAYVLVRISTPGEHVVLRIAPEGDLAGEVYFGRMMVAQHLPAARIIHYDLTCTLVPFCFALESYMGGISAAQISEDYLLRALARQVGRALRRMHRVEAHGWGRPNPANRWITSDWHTILAQLHTRLAPPPTDELVFGETERAAIATLLEHPLLECTTPRLMHGALGPSAVRCTIGDHVQLEALLDPGYVVGGDGLLDLAFGIDPAYPQAWRMGLMEGYAVLTPLNATDQARLRLLQVLACYWSACWRYAHAEPHVATRDQALELINANDWERAAGEE